MEDLDPRSIPGCSAKILGTLEAFALHWDGAVEYQSRRTVHYQAALNRLRAAGVTFECSCSRAQLAHAGVSSSRYPGTCRCGPRRLGRTATRVRIDECRAITFEDRFQGPCACPPGSLGDVIVRRRDGVFAYQLAVIVDDALQGVTDVVRGADLLESTGWQILLHETLGLALPRYAHLPLITEPGGAKLAKSRRSVALQPACAGAQLHLILRLLNQCPPLSLAQAPAPEVLTWAVAHWNPSAFHGVRTIALDGTACAPAGSSADRGSPVADEPRQVPHAFRPRRRRASRDECDPGDRPRAPSRGSRRLP
jgi:glutamyl-Q tRNA(Asp) synthetase